MDLCAALEAPLALAPGQRALLPTGFAIELARPEYVALIFARSSLGARHGVALPNGVGVIDSDYRGEVHVALANHGNEAYVIQPASVWHRWLWCRWRTPCCRKWTSSAALPRRRGLRLHWEALRQKGEHNDENETHPAFVVFYSGGHCAGRHAGQRVPQRAVFELAEAITSPSASTRTRPLCWTYQW